MNSALFEKNNELLLTFLKKEELLKSTWNLFFIVLCEFYRLLEDAWTDVENS